MKTKMILASNNAGKLAELRTLLAPLGIELVSMREAGVTGEADETGSTFAENAELKAAYVTAQTGEAAIADDSGLAVDALGGAPGVYSARYTGRHDDSDAARNALVLHNLSGAADRSAAFVCAVCVTLPDGTALHTSGVCRGQIASAPRGSNGFGYDPLFLPDEYRERGLTMAELTADEKNTISHRGKAVRAMIGELKHYYADK